MTRRRWWLVAGRGLSGAMVFAVAVWALATGVGTPGHTGDDVELLRAGTYLASAYCLKGKTTDGGHVRAGVVASDPSVLPTGSIIELHDDRLTPWGIFHGRHDGVYVASDTGDDVQGHRLDIWMPSCIEAWAFGRHEVDVKILR